MTSVSFDWSIGFWVLILSSGVIQSYASKTLQPCMQTKDCPDSGTICKTAKPGASSLSNDPNDFTVEVKPPTGESSMSGFDPMTDSEKNKAGITISTERIELDDEPVTESDEKIETGRIIPVNGWKCVVIDIKSGTEANQDALNNANGAGAMKTPLDAEGKLVKLGKITCKVTGPLKKAEEQPNIVKFPSITELYTRPPPSAPGRCVCDSARRFACTTDTDCFERFQKEDVLCYPSDRCPNLLDAPGYCRMKSADILSDSI